MRVYTLEYARSQALVHASTSFKPTAQLACTSIDLADLQYCRPIDLAVFEPLQRLVRFTQWECLDGATDRDLGGQRQEFLGILAGNVRHRPQRALAPQQAIRHLRDGRGVDRVYAQRPAIP